MLSKERLAEIQARPRNDGILGDVASFMVDQAEIIEELVGEVQRLTTQADTARALHKNWNGYCSACSGDDAEDYYRWPCPTVAALGVVGESE